MALSHEKYLQKQQLLIERTARALRVSIDEATALLLLPRQQSVRVNPLKTDPSSALEGLRSYDPSLVQFSWMPHGVLLDKGALDRVRDSSLVTEGHVYIQNAASWLPVVALAVNPGQRVLDMCAAPGGKTSHIAAYTHNNAQITANDNSRPRLLKMQRNLERLGVHNSTYTLHDATKLTRSLPAESFERILLDAPCSGEGMMTLDNKKAFESWSVAHIKRLQQMQKRLIVQAWELLTPGGTLVYSTCTMAPEENEAVVDYLLRHNDNCVVESLSNLSEQLPNVVQPVLEWNGKQYAPQLANALRLAPNSTIEAFFVVKLTKRATTTAAAHR